jgi:predicted nucleic acid-binding protein
VEATLTTLADSRLPIAAINRGDRHHRWAVEHITAARRSRVPIVVPQLVVGDAFTKLRYDKRVSPRRDTGVAVTLFALVDGNPDTFRVLSTPAGAYSRARAILTQYFDHLFSFIDAVILHLVDQQPSISRVLTVDGSDFRSYRFARPVEIVTPR